MSRQKGSEAGGKLSIATKLTLIDGRTLTNALTHPDEGSAWLAQVSGGV